MELCQYRRALAKTVKSLPRPLVFAGLGLILALGLGGRTESARAQSILLGPTPRQVKTKPIYDPSLPAGAERAPQMAIAEANLARLCSGTHPLCVTWAKGDQTSRILEALSALEVAFDHLVLDLGLPAPERDDAGQPLTWRLTSEDEPLSVRLSPKLATPCDTAAVVCRSGTESEIERRAHLCMGEAIAARLDAGETPQVRRGYALELWWMLGHLTPADVSAIVRSQSNPQSIVFTRDDLSSAATAALFFEYMGRRYGSDPIGALPTGMLALSAQKTPADDWRYRNMPDVTDVYRTTFGDKQSEWGQRILEFAFARRLVNDSRQALLPLSQLGEIAVPRVDWIIKASSLPRRVAPPLPLQPWGSVYVRLDLDVPKDKLQLGVKIDWEGPVQMRWQVARLDQAGNEFGRIDIAFEEHGTEIERRLTALEGTRSLLIVGTNLGGVDLAHPFDPDHEPFEPHGCTVYIGKL